jgi:hypothetical protein
MKKSDSFARHREIARFATVNLEILIDSSNEI